MSWIKVKRLKAVKFLLSLLYSLRTKLQNILKSIKIKKEYKINWL